MQPSSFPIRSGPFFEESSLALTILTVVGALSSFAGLQGRPMPPFLYGISPNPPFSLSSKVAGPHKAFQEKNLKDSIPCEAPLQTHQVERQRQRFENHEKASSLNARKPPFFCVLRIFYLQIKFSPPQLKIMWNLTITSPERVMPQVIYGLKGSKDSI